MMGLSMRCKILIEEIKMNCSYLSALKCRVNCADVEKEVIS